MEQQEVEVTYKNLIQEYQKEMNKLMSQIMIARAKEVQYKEELNNWQQQVQDLASQNNDLNEQLIKYQMTKEEQTEGEQA